MVFTRGKDMDSKRIMVLKAMLGLLLVINIALFVINICIDKFDLAIISLIGVIVSGMAFIED